MPALLLYLDLLLLREPAYRHFCFNRPVFADIDATKHPSSAQEAVSWGTALFLRYSLCALAWIHEAALTAPVSSIVPASQAAAALAARGPQAAGLLWVERSTALTGLSLLGSTFFPTAEAAIRAATTTSSTAATAAAPAPALVPALGVAASPTALSAALGATGTASLGSALGALVPCWGAVVSVLATAAGDLVLALAFPALLRVCTRVLSPSAPAPAPAPATTAPRPGALASLPPQPALRPGALAALRRGALASLWLSRSLSALAAAGTGAWELQRVADAVFAAALATAAGSVAFPVAGSHASVGATTSSSSSSSGSSNNGSNSSRSGSGSKRAALAAVVLGLLLRAAAVIIVAAVLAAATSGGEDWPGPGPGLGLGLGLGFELGSLGLGD